MSPEYLSGKMFASNQHKSDVWASGCILYELVVFDYLINAKSGMAETIKMISEFKVSKLKKFENEQIDKLIRL
mgnify:CR=1 FL=1